MIIGRDVPGVLSLFIKMLFVTKPDIFCILYKLRVCKFPKNSMDVNYMHPEIKDQGMFCEIIIS